MKTREIAPENARAERLKYGSMPGLHLHTLFDNFGTKKQRRARPMKSQ